MFSFIYFTALALLWQQPPAAASARPSMQEIRSRLEAQEKLTTRQPDPAAFARIAALAFERAARAPDRRVWFEACASQFSRNRPDCATRLQAVVNDVAIPLKDRAAAGAALVSRQVPGASTALYRLVMDLNTKQLAEVAPHLGVLPKSQSIPLLRKLLSSPVAGEQVAACRSLGTIDAPEVLPLLKEAVAQSLPSTEVWNACMVARARLREPDSVYTISGYTHYMAGEPLLNAAEVMLLVGNEQGVDVLKKVAREASPIVQLRAAAQLATTDAAFAARILEPRLQDANPAVRAQALVVERRLARTPSPRIRSMLLDSDGLVQLRAAETLMEWAARENPK